MDDFQNAIKQGRSEVWSIIEKSYDEIRSKNSKLIEYIYLHLIKTVPHSKIMLGERWVKGKAVKDKRYLEVDKEITIFIEIEDEMGKYFNKEDDIEILKPLDKLYISGHIKDTQILCCDSININELTLEILTNRVNYIITNLKEKQNQL